MSKRKAYNRVKQLTRLADHKLKNLFVVYTDHLSGCHFYDHKRKALIKANDLLVGCIEMPHMWCAYLAVFGRTQLGDEYMKSLEIETQSRHRHTDLAGVLEAHHLKLIKELPDHHRCGVGWLASPSGAKLSESEAAEIFTKLEAWA